MCFYLSETVLYDIIQFLINIFVLTVSFFILENMRENVVGLNLLKVKGISIQTEVKQAHRHTFTQTEDSDFLVAKVCEHISMEIMELKRCILQQHNVKNHIDNQREKSPIPTLLTDNYQLNQQVQYCILNAKNFNRIERSTYSTPFFFSR